MAQESEIWDFRKTKKLWQPAGWFDPGNIFLKMLTKIGRHLRTRTIFLQGTPSWALARWRPKHRNRASHLSKSAESNSRAKKTAYSRWSDPLSGYSGWSSPWRERLRPKKTLSGIIDVNYESEVQGGPTGFYSGNLSILYAVREMSFCFSVTSLKQHA